MPSMDLLKSEQEAYDFVKKTGLARAARIANAISRRINRRIQDACDSGVVSPVYVRRTPLEESLLYRIQLGTQLVDTCNTPEAAHARILKRIAERKANRKNKQRTEALAA